MASQSLSSRLHSLTDAYRNTITLIQRLQKLPSTPGTFSSSQSDPRLELSSEIHQSLKEQEDELESLRQEIEDDSTSISGPFTLSGRAFRSNREQVHERESVAAMVAKLGEDLRTARSSFRRAQLEAKRNADAAKRKERELLFANRSQDADGLQPGRRKGQEKLTQDELALNASSDITAGLRRTHALLQSNVEQSKFAQQTLNESTDALASLSENYAGLDSLLKSSGGLVRQLIRSNKSDTWYLTTAFYILVVTLSWLVFRRILYGPLWWLVWQPLKLIWWLATATLTAVGVLGGRNAEIVMSSSALGGPPTTVHMSSAGRPTWDAEPAYMPVLPQGGGWGVRRPQGTPEADRKEKGKNEAEEERREEKDEGEGKEEEKEKNLVDEIGEMTEKEGEAQEQEGTVLVERREEDGPPNPKKRMFEQNPGAGPASKRDEL